MATRAGLRLADFVVTEAGFGADLGAEKFVDIKCRKSGLRPDVAVVVATVRALKYHGGVALADLGTEDVGAVEAGHGQPAPAPATTSARSTASRASSRSTGSRPTPTPRWRRSSSWWPPRACRPSRRPTSPTAASGAQDLAKGVLQALDEPSPYTFSFTYDDELSLTEKVETIATRLYGAGAGDLGRQGAPAAACASSGTATARCRCAWRRRSTRSRPTRPRVGAPSGHELHVREVRLSAGAGFVVVVCGDMMTMPGLPRDPSAVAHRPGRRRDHPGPVLGRASLVEEVSTRRSFLAAARPPKAVSKPGDGTMRLFRGFVTGLTALLNQRDQPARRGTP